MDNYITGRDWDSLNFRLNLRKVCRIALQMSASSVSTNMRVVFTNLVQALQSTKLLNSQPLHNHADDNQAHATTANDAYYSLSTLRKTNAHPRYLIDP